MKKLFLIVLVTGMTTAAFCQKTFILSHQDKPGFLTVSAGTSLPVGRFASCSPADDQACMAGKGLVINASAGCRIFGPVGLMIRGEQHRNTVNTSAMLDALYRNDTDIWTAKADDWSVLNVMAGPYVSLPMGRFSVDVRLLAGRALAVLPSTFMAGNFGTTDMSVKTTGTQSTAFSLGGGISVCYRLGPGAALLLNTDYSRADFMFNNLVSTATNGSVRSQSGAFSSSRLVSVVSVSAGVAVLIGTNYRPF